MLDQLLAQFFSIARLFAGKLIHHIEWSSSHTMEVVKVSCVTLLDENKSSYRMLFQRSLLI
jgi:hypothetical protein